MHRPSSTIAAVALAATVAGCATGDALRNARRSELQQDYDRAVVEYSRVLQARPENVDARTGLERTRVRAALAHYDRGRRLAAQGKMTDAVAEYQLAAEMNPESAEIGAAL